MKHVAYISEGSVSQGVIAYLSEDENIERFSIGSMMKIKGNMRSYLAMIVDAGIKARYHLSMISREVPEEFKEVLISKFSSELRMPWIKLALIAQRDFKGGEASVADSMPSFYSKVYDLKRKDAKLFFSEEDEISLWNLGHLKTTSIEEILIPINIDSLVNLHFGIFGKTGTGKTFLGNIIASMILLSELRRTEKRNIRLLIFDMHSEYAFKLRKTGGEEIAEGVGLLFKYNFVKYTIDPEEARKYKTNLLRINLKEVSVDDLRLVGQLFGLTETFLAHLGTISSKLRRRYGNFWFIALLLSNQAFWEKLENSDDDEKKNILYEFLSKYKYDDWEVFNNNFERIIGDNTILRSIRANVSKLVKIADYPITVSESDVDKIVIDLTDERGQSVIISFGKFDKEVVLYLLLANLIAKKLRNKIMEVIQKFGEPKTRIIIFLEEAHYFLGKETYRLSPFGEIAREMRKRGVTLCIIDQKPYELDPDVISMLWTNFVFNLTDRRDIEAAIYGAPNAELFRSMIPRLKSREVFIFGEAVDFPVVLTVRNYREFVEHVKELLKEEEKRLEEIEEAIGY